MFAAAAALLSVFAMREQVLRRENAYGANAYRKHAVGDKQNVARRNTVAHGASEEHERRARDGQRHEDRAQGYAGTGHAEGPADEQVPKAGMARTPGDALVPSGSAIARHRKRTAAFSRSRICIFVPRSPSRSKTRHRPAALAAARAVACRRNAEAFARVPVFVGLARKVPAIIALFWVVKILTTALGESVSDYLVFSINPYVAVGLGAIGFAVALVLQFRARRYNAWIYWFAVTMVAVFGTMAADVTHVVLHVPYAYSAGFFALALAVIFALWRKVEGTLSIHSVNTPSREVFYWLAVVTTFALGTATGDLTAITLHLGYLASGIVFTALIACIGAARWAVVTIASLERHRVSGNAVFAFWAAYVLTRPLGASFADWTGKPQSFGGLGYGDGPVAGVLFLLLAGFVTYLAITRADVDSG